MHNFLCKETVFETEFSTYELDGKLLQTNFSLWTYRMMDGEPWRFQDTWLPQGCQGIISIILALSSSTTGFHKPELLFQGIHCVNRRYFLSQEISSFHIVFSTL